MARAAAAAWLLAAVILGGWMIYQLAMTGGCMFWTRDPAGDWVCGETTAETVGNALSVVAVNLIFPIAPILLLAYFVGLRKSRRAAWIGAVFGVLMGLAGGFYGLLMGPITALTNAFLIVPGVLSAAAAMGAHPKAAPISKVPPLPDGLGAAPSK